MSIINLTGAFKIAKSKDTDVFLCSNDFEPSPR